MHSVRKAYYIHSLGCNKNTVDSEIIMSLLKARGYSRVDQPENASRIIINTCAFIDSAKEEAIEAIMALSQRKHEEAFLVVTGCMPQIYASEIRRNIPEADIIAGSGDLAAVIDSIDTDSKGGDFPSTRDIPKYYSNEVLRSEFLVNRGYAYIKISEGCNRSCSFCLIPQIKGNLRSRSVEEIVREARYLEEQGAEELILISQDTLSYGSDRNDESNLRFLLNQILENTEVSFIRLLYLRPSKKLLSLLDLFVNGRIVPYFDIPVQHASEQVLKKMNREGNAAQYESIIAGIRNHIPHAVLRTTLITGFPGEGKREFEELLSFIEHIRFNHVGVFVFSPQRETVAYNLHGKVKKGVAERRKETLLSCQRSISRELLQSEVGKTFDVLIEEKVEKERLYFGRSYHFAPDVDGLFVVESDGQLKTGSVVKVLTHSAEDYDLHGSVCI